MKSEPVSDISQTALVFELERFRIFLVLDEFIKLLS